MSEINKTQNKNSNFSCFSAIFKSLICSTNLPTYPDHDDHRKITLQKVKPSLNPKFDPTQIVINTNNNPQLIELKPGIVGRLMGLESNSIPVKTTQNDESLFFRSKSLNSLNFFPDFNSNKASVFHRRSASTSSFSFKIDEEIDYVKEKQSNKVKQGRRDKTEEVNYPKEKRQEKLGFSRNKRFEEGYTAKNMKKKEIGGRRYGLIRDQKCELLLGQNKEKLRETGVNNVGPVISTKKNRVYSNQKKKQNANNKNNSNVDHEVSSDSVSRSPVSVLDHHHHHHHHHLYLLDHSPSKEEKRKERGSSRKKARPKNTVEISKFLQPQETSCVEEHFPNKNKGTKFDKLFKNENDEQEVAEKACRLAEDKIINDIKSQEFRVHFVDELCFHFGGKILESLLNELIMEELIYTN